jgi:membrane-associated phospholipid phosphatase
VTAPRPAVKPGPGSPALRVRVGKWVFGAAAVAVLIAIAFWCDGPVQRLVPASQDPSTKALAQLISKYCDWPFVLLCALIPTLYGVWGKSAEWTKIGLALLLAASIAGVIATSIRSTTGRTRPNATEPQGWYGIRRGSEWLIGKSQFNSFPSGHVATAAGFAGVLLLARRRWTLLAVLFAAAVAWSRIYLGYHHFSDTFVSVLIGSAVAWLTWYRLLPRIAMRWPALKT